MKIEKKIIYVIIASLVIICATAAFFIYKISMSEKDLVYQKCPDDYGTDDAGSAEYLADFDKWTNDFYNAHPEATLSEWSEARHQFWVDNNCTVALQRYKDAKEGKADPASVERVNNAIQEAIDNPGHNF